MNNQQSTINTDKPCNGNQQSTINPYTGAKAINRDISVPHPIEKRYI